MKSELADVKKGATWQNIYDTLWHIATVRYVTLPQLKKAFPNNVWRKKCATPRKITLLRSKQFLKQFKNEVLTVTEKAVRLLKEYSDYNTEILKLPRGKGERDTLYNTDVLMQIIKLPDFYALFYPDFYEKPSDQQPFLIPDGALVLNRNGQAKLVFLEIERKKPGWKNHLQGKKWKYETIAEREETCTEWWRDWCKLLKLQHCQVDEFGFMVWCIGDFKPATDWNGWRFRETVSHLSP